MAKSGSSSSRHIVMALMKSAQETGQSASSFILSMREKGLSYRRQTMLSDWRSIGEIEAKAGAMRYIRRDYYPTEKTIAAVAWSLSQEYMYKVKVKSRQAPGEPIAERFVNIMSDVPMTPGQVLSALSTQWVGYEKYGQERIEDATVWSAYRRIDE
jgi:hypothetical protein